MSWWVNRRHDLALGKREPAILALTGVWPPLAPAGRPAGAGNRAYNSYWRPARMPAVPSPYPEATRDVEDVDGM
jgi:hypothetical protein